MMKEDMSVTSTNTINQTVVNNNNPSGTTQTGTTLSSNSSSSSSSSSNSSTSSTSSTNNNNNDSTNSNNRSRCNLIVNYLPQSLKENDFCQLFAKIGPIKTCKLMYDRQTGYSFGYGFVDFQSADDAAKAIETLNGFQLEHKRLKVAYARPNSEDTKNTNLYIKNLPNTYDEQNLLDLFSQYGEVVQVRLLRDQVTTFSKRVGFVIMSTKQMAQQAIDHLDNQIPPNGTEPIHVKYADEEGKKRQAPRGSGGSTGGSLNGYFNNSGYKHNNHHHNSGNNHHNGGSGGFQNHGKMKSRGQNGQNRYNPMGANFAAYQAANAMAGFDAFLNGATGSNHHHQQHHNYNMNSNNNHYSSSNHHHHNNNNNHHHNNNRHNSHHNNNHNTNGHHSHHQNGGASTTTIQLTQHSTLSGLNDADIKGGHIIYVYGIGPHANESDLYSLFQNVGRILRVNVIKNQKTGLGKGYGFVVFEHYEEACFAVQQMNGFVYHARPLQVSLKAFNK